MYVHVWEYEVRPDRVDEFVANYSSSGSWARLFRRAPGFMETELLSDTERSGRFVTVDRWASEAVYAAFRHELGPEYTELDRRCERLTVSERFVGAFEPA